MTTPPNPLDFFGRLRWIDGRPLMDTIEGYRRELLLKALYTFRTDGSPQYNLVLAGRAKKNSKSTDLVLVGLFKLLVPESPQGNDAYVVANDEDQAGDDLGLAKKLVEANASELSGELERGAQLPLAHPRRQIAGPASFVDHQDINSKGQTHEPF